MSANNRAVSAVPQFFTALTTKAHTLRYKCAGKHSFVRIIQENPLIYLFIFFTRTMGYM